MQIIRKLTALAVISSVSLGVAGCGGGAPSTGEQVTSKPDNEAKKKMLDGYLKTMVKPKGQNKAKTP